MKRRDIITGVFVVAGTALFVLAVFLIGSQNKTFARHVEFYTEFANVNGVIKGTKVRVAGFDAGEVTDISVPASPPSRFRLKLRVVEQVHGLVRSDSLVTIATEGVVGNKFLLIRQGSEKSPEAAPGSTLPSREALDMAELMEQSAGLLTNASGTMKSVADKLTGTLDSVKTTVDNANDVIAGVKQGKGTVGMLLHDETAANDVRQSMSNINQATTSMKHASQQADEMATDFRSRNLGEKADTMMSTAQNAVRDLDATSKQLHATVTSALEPDSQGAEAGTNIRQSLSNLNRATGNMAEDTEALKHQFFFRGFFRKRGYFSLADLNPDQYRKDKVFGNPSNPRVWIGASELFTQNPDDSVTLTAQGKEKITSAMAQLGDSALGGPLIIEGYAASDGAGQQLALSRARAILVRDYLHTRFRLDLQNLGIVALREIPPPELHKPSWDGISIVSLRAPK